MEVKGSYFYKNWNKGGREKLLSSLTNKEKKNQIISVSHCQPPASFHPHVLTYTLLAVKNKHSE